MRLTDAVSKIVVKKNAKTEPARTIIRECKNAKVVQKKK